MDRRRFLKWSIGAAALPAVNACSQMDQLIMGSGSDVTQSVLILGAGVSGLTAARELKKARVPFRVFEGATRVGGRAFTLDDFNLAGQHAELGAEWILASDAFTLGLCKELHLRTLEFPADHHLWHFMKAGSGPEFSVKNSQGWMKTLAQMDRCFLEIKERRQETDWDAVSTQDFINELTSVKSFTSKNDLSSALLWMQRLVQLEWGCEPADLSALAFLDRFGSNPTGTTRLQSRRFKLLGGMQNLTRALYDKVAGVLPDGAVVFNHRLQAVRSQGDGLELEFQTPKGRSYVQARVVICTLPFSVLREVRGYQNLQFSAEKINAIENLQYGTHGKIALSYPQRFWSEKTHVWTGDLASQWIWDSSFEGSAQHYIHRGVLSAQLAGSAGAQLGPQSLAGVREDVKRLVMANTPSDVLPQDEETQMMNWSLNPWSKGSVAILKPRQVQSFSSHIAQSERKGSFIFAGEHTSMSFMGTVNGAIESGIRAAMEAGKFKAEFRKALV